MSDRIHPRAGRAMFEHECEAHGAETRVIAWDAGADAIETPRCAAGHEFDRVGGDDHTETVPRPTEDEQLEAQARAERAAIRGAQARHAKLAAVHEQLRQEEQAAQLTA